MLARSWDRNSVCPFVSPFVHSSVCLSVTRVLCDETTEHTADILTLHGNQSSFLTPKEVGGHCPLPPGICAYSDPPPLKNADFDLYLLITSQP